MRTPRIETIRTDRLDLVSLRLPLINWLLAGARPNANQPAFHGDWLQTEQSILRIRRDDLRNHPSWAPWMLRAIVLRGPAPRAIGHIGFHGPPDRGTVELGYAVEPKSRRLGFATESVIAMLIWARTQGVERCRAAVAPQNQPSRSLLERLDFTLIGSQEDPVDGHELVFERSLLDITG